MRLPDIEPKQVYWLVFSCPCCGRRARASSLLRNWARAPVVQFDDAEMLVTKGKGFRRIENIRSPLWEVLAETKSATGGWRFRQVVADVLDGVAERSRASEGPARDAARRARYR